MIPHRPFRGTPTPRNGQLRKPQDRGERFQVRRPRHPRHRVLDGATELDRLQLALVVDEPAASVVSGQSTARSSPSTTSANRLIAVERFTPESWHNPSTGRPNASHKRSRANPVCVKVRVFGGVRARWVGPVTGWGFGSNVVVRVREWPFRSAGVQGFAGRAGFRVAPDCLPGPVSVQ
jgi:hypothetical protein